MAVALDTLAAVKRLKAAHFEEPQAEALAELLREREQLQFMALATKADLEQLASGTKAGLERLASGTKADLERLEHKLRAAISDSQTSMIKWFTGVMLAQGLGIVVATVTIIKLMQGGLP